MNDYAHQRWLTRLEGIDLEIVRAAIICGVPLLEPGVIERVLHDEAWVCRRENAAAFYKLRGLLLMHEQVSDRAVEALGADDAAAIGHEIRRHLRARVGDQLDPGA